MDPLDRSDALERLAKHLAAGAGLTHAKRRR